nr:hypothetical protein CFP56_66136 [Quercus suber]
MCSAVDIRYGYEVEYARPDARDSGLSRSAKISFGLSSVRRAASNLMLRHHPAFDESSTNSALAVRQALCLRLPCMVTGSSHNDQSWQPLRIMGDMMSDATDD